jgi:CheY-like chemotaxis protein
LPAYRVAERAATIADDRDDLNQNDAVLLIVEDDPHYARILVDLAHDKGFKVLVAMRGSEGVESRSPVQAMAVSLDVFLPDMLGWTVLSQLKQDPETRHIPVQIVTLEEDRQHGLARGAFSFITKPTTTEGLEAAMGKIKTYAAPRRKRLLIVEDNAAEQMSITELLGHDDLEVVVADTGEAALAAMREQPVRLRGARPAVAGHVRIRRPRAGQQGRQARRRSGHRVHRARALRRGGCATPHARAQRCGEGRRVTGATPRRNLAVPASRLLRLADEKQRMLERLHRSDEDLLGKSVLVVDDDIRNIFALSSVLERRGMRVFTANTGKEAIQLLESTPELSIVLMDIMMPEMDGYQTMQKIRENPAFRRLPIVALTAKR